MQRTCIEVRDTPINTVTCELVANKKTLIMTEALPQELLITTLSYLLIKDIHSCSFLNTQWYEMIHSQQSSSSQEIWKTLCQTTFSGSIELHNDYKTWKQEYKAACSLKFIEDSKLQKISYLNNNGTVDSNFESWQTLTINKLINLDDYKNKSGKFCFDIVLDDFNPKRKPINYYSVVIGVSWTNNVKDKIDIENVLGFSSDRNEVGYYSGNRRVHKSSKGYNFTGAIGDSIFPDNMIKHGDVVHVELSLHNGTFDIDFYVNGELQEPVDSSHKIHFKDIPAYSIQPCVSLFGDNKLTLRRSFHN
jgi:hypothetical protein